MSMKEFWDTKIVSRDDYYIAGNKGGVVWRVLEVEDYILPNADILEIGCGYGYCTKEMSDKGANIYVVDISERAIDNVRQFVKGWWKSEEIESLPSNKFDLVLSFLVSQHISNEDLAKQIKEAVRSLKDTGLFALQFSYSLNPKEEKINTEQDMQEGISWRSLADVDTMVRQGDGEIVLVKEKGHYARYNCGWYIIHIRKVKGGKNEYTEMG